MYSWLTWRHWIYLVGRLNLYEWWSILAWNGVMILRFILGIVLIKIYSDDLKGHWILFSWKLDLEHFEIIFVTFFNVNNCISSFRWCENLKIAKLFSCFHVCWKKYNYKRNTRIMVVIWDFSSSKAKDGFKKKCSFHDIHWIFFHQ